MPTYKGVSKSGVDLSVAGVPPGFPSEGCENWETGGALTASTQGTSVTSNAVAHTKGSYTQLIASTARKSTWLILTIAISNAVTTYLLDIAKGTSGNETDILSNIFISSVAAVYQGHRFFIPIEIPAGSRVSARCQDSVGGKYLNIVIQLGG